jgi:hypothetical protein
VRDAYLVEYTALKLEQLERIKARDGYLYTTLAAVVAVVAAVIQTGQSDLLLALPPIVAALGWTRLRNDQLVVAIREYLRDDLGPRLGDGALRWETPPRRTSHRFVQLGVDLVTFWLSGLIAAIVWSRTGTDAVWGDVAWAADVALVSVVSGFIATDAINAHRRAQPSEGVDQ